MQGCDNAQRDEPNLDCLKAETPSKVEALVHAIEELISQATDAGHDGIARSLSDNLGGKASLPATPLRPSRSMPAAVLDISDQHGRNSDEGCNGMGTERLTSARLQSGGAMQPDSHVDPRLVSQQCIAPAPANAEMGSSTKDTEARLGAADLISPTDAADGPRSPDSDRFTDAADWPDPDRDRSACGLDHAGNSEVHPDLQEQHRHQEMCNDTATDTVEVPGPSLDQANFSRCGGTATQLPPRVHFESLQLGQHVNDAIQRDHEPSPWTQFGSFKSTVRLSPWNRRAPPDMGTALQAPCTTAVTVGRISGCFTCALRHVCNHMCPSRLNCSPGTGVSDAWMCLWIK